MPQYEITDPRTGRTLVVEGTRPPTQDDATRLFQRVALDAPLEARGLRQGLADLAEAVPYVASAIAPTGRIAQGAVGAGVEAGRELMAGEGLSPRKIGTAALTGAGAAQVTRTIGPIARGLQRVGGRVKESMAAWTDDLIRDASQAFRVPQTQATDVVGRELAKRRLAPKAESVSRMERGLGLLQEQKEGILGRVRQKVNPGRAVGLARQDVGAGPLGQEARSAANMEAFERAAGEVRRNPDLTTVRALRSTRQLPEGSPGTILGPSGDVVSRPTEEVITRKRVFRPVSALRAERTKSATGKSTNLKFGQQQGIEPEIDKAMTRGFRREIERVAPQVAPINQQQQEMIVLRRVLESAMKKSGRRAPTSIPEFAGAATTIADPSLRSAGIMGIATLGRPGIASKVGQALYRTGEAVEGTEGVASPALLALLRALALEQDQQP